MNKIYLLFIKTHILRFMFVCLTCVQHSVWWIIRPNNVLYQTLFVNCVPQAIVLYVSFLCHFYCSVDSVVSFSSSATSLQWSHRHLAAYLQCKVRLMHCMALLYRIWKGFGAIVMFGGYSDSSVFSLDTSALYHVKWITYQLLKVNCYVSYRA